MTVLPSMPESQWKKYEAWVAAFGNQFSANSRRLRRQLSEARDVTVAVTIRALSPEP